MWYYNKYIFGGDWYFHDLRIMSKCERKKGHWIKAKIMTLLKLEKMSLIAYDHVTSMTWKTRFRDNKSVKKCFYNVL